MRPLIDVIAAARDTAPVARASATELRSKPTVSDTATVTIRAPLADFDTWDLTEQLRHVDRILSGVRFSTELQHPPTSDQPPAPTNATRRKLASTTLPTAVLWRQSHAFQNRLDGCGRRSGSASASRHRSALCRYDYGAKHRQSIGLPITLLGPVALLLGMMMQPGSGMERKTARRPVSCTAFKSVSWTWRPWQLNWPLPDDGNDAAAVRAMNASCWSS